MEQLKGAGAGDAAEALRMMSSQRNELAKARRALEQIVDTSRGL